MFTVDHIKKEIKNISVENLPSYLKAYENDTRAEIRKLFSSYSKKHESYIKELKRIEMMSFFENKHYQNGKKYIAGIDEVGRGPLAGPVFAAMVILPQDCDILNINDSKKLSVKKREELFHKIKNKAVAISIQSEDNETIDKINILNATISAMRKCVENTSHKPDAVLVDCVRISGIEVEQENIIKGDEKSISIAAASIIAKVTRDRIMDEYDKIYPEYGFSKNKGYGTKEHIAAIKKYGICEIHRKSFVRNII